MKELDLANLGLEAITTAEALRVNGGCGGSPEDRMGGRGHRDDDKSDDWGFRRRRKNHGIKLLPS